jgi:hypothetical protein
LEIDKMLSVDGFRLCWGVVRHRTDVDVDGLIRPGITETASATGNVILGLFARSDLFLDGIEAVGC